MAGTWGLRGKNVQAPGAGGENARGRGKGRGKREEDEENPYGSYIKVSLHFSPLKLVQGCINHFGQHKIPVTLVYLKLWCCAQCSVLGGLKLQKACILA